MFPISLFLFYDLKQDFKVAKCQSNEIDRVSKIKFEEYTNTLVWELHEYERAEAYMSMREVVGWRGR